MSAARIFAVVGASGVGKDTVMAAIARARPDIHWVRRVITRPEVEGGEPFEGVSETEFARRAAAGAFALDWHAHGLRYGVPNSVQDRLADGQIVMVNLSRAVLGRAAEVFDGLIVVNITASDTVRAERLARRGREDAAGIAARIARPAPPVPEGLPVYNIDNSGALDDSVAACLAVLTPERV